MSGPVKRDGSPGSFSLLVSIVKCVWTSPRSLERTGSLAVSPGASLCKEGPAGEVGSQLVKFTDGSAQDPCSVFSPKLRTQCTWKWLWSCTLQWRKKFAKAIKMIISKRRSFFFLMPVCSLEAFFSFFTLRCYFPLTPKFTAFWGIEQSRVFVPISCCWHGHQET